MAKQPKNTSKDVATDQKPDKELKGNLQPDPEKTATNSQDEQAAQVPTANAESGSIASGDDQQGGGDGIGSGDSKNSELDIEDKDKGTGTQGDHPESRNDSDPETKEVKQYKNVAAKIFKENPLKGSVLYFTSDAIPFWDEGDAIKHTHKLADKTIKPILKDQ